MQLEVGNRLIVNTQLNNKVCHRLRNLVEERTAELLDHRLGIVEWKSVNVFNRLLEVSLVLD